MPQSKQPEPPIGPVLPAIDLDQTREALRSFKPTAFPTSSARPHSASFKTATNFAINEYFAFVAKCGRPLFSWDLIRPVFLWKLQSAMLEMQAIEADGMADDADADALFNDEELKTVRTGIMNDAAELTGTPFTIQRLCELLVSPSQHYKRTEKFYRALDKNIVVVTSVNEQGERITGVEDEMPMISTTGDPKALKIEQRFFVDEIEMEELTGKSVHNSNEAKDKKSMGTPPHSSEDFKPVFSPPTQRSSSTSSSSSSSRMPVPPPADPKTSSLVTAAGGAQMKPEPIGDGEAMDVDEPGGQPTARRDAAEPNESPTPPATPDDPE